MEKWEGWQEARKAFAIRHGFDFRVVDAVGPGWIPILDRLISRLKELGWDGQLRQVKQKVGGLRFYIGVSTEEIRQAIDMAEGECERTCEHCGETGLRRRNASGWLMVLCDTCAVVYGYAEEGKKDAP